MLFSSVKMILEQNIVAIASARRLRPPQVLEKALLHLDNMSAEWRSGDTPDIAYEDPLCRWAYIFAHVPVHANLFYRVLIRGGQLCRSFGVKLVSEKLSILVFGGGPGTELLGFAKYYEGRNSDQQIEIDVAIIDRVGQWSENISAVKDTTSTFYSQKFGKKRDWPALIDVHTFSLDFSDLNSFANLPTIFKKDIFVLNFVVSEVFDLEELLPILRNMVAGCAKGAHFLIVDRSDPATIDKMNTLVEELGLRVEAHEKTQDSVDTDEQKAELQKIIDWLQRQPRVTWKAAWVLAEKP